MSFVLVAALSALTLPTSTPDDIRARVTVDSALHEVAVTVGPYDLQTMPAGMSHESMEHDQMHGTPTYRFEWPVEGWFRGFRIELKDKRGNAVDRRVLHHMIMVNFDRRQLFYPAVERLLGIGQETGDVNVPKTIGVPLHPGQRLGMYLAWANQTGLDLEGVEFTVYMLYSPSNLNPRPVDALPVYMDVNLTVGGANSFDVPPGRFEKSWEFTAPTSGHLLGVSGHLHDYGVSVRLEDVESGKVLTQIDATRTPDGMVTKMGRKLFGVSGKGLKMEAGKRYRVVGVYDNTTGKVFPAAMASIVGLFAPDDMTKWPALDLADEQLQMDLAKLDERGGGHNHGGEAEASHDHREPQKLQRR